LAMIRNIFAYVACFLLLSIAPVAATPTTHPVPAPEADAGLLALAMVGGVAFLTYWRKRSS
jgi:membrane protease YdiL (CAAX protease family)